MSDPVSVTRVTIDSHTRLCLTAITILLTLLVAGMALEGLPATPAARAAEEPLPNAAAQREEIIRQARQTNDKLDKLIALLTDGQAKVQTVAPDGAGATNAKPKE